MKYQVEWGIPALDAPPAGRFGEFTCANAADAIKLAEHIAWTHIGISANLSGIRVKNCPRVTWYNQTKSFWVAISKLDGKARGPARDNVDKPSLLGETRVQIVTPPKDWKLPKDARILTCNDPKDRAGASQMPAHIANRLWWKRGPDDEPIPFLDDL